MASSDSRIAVGVIRRAHGVRGEASVELWTDSAERFDELTVVTLVSPDERSTREATIEGSRAHLDRVLVKFAGISSPEDLGGLLNWTIEIPESEARPLEENEYFLHDLAGLTLVDAQGTTHGTVEEAYEGGGGVLLNVKRANGTMFEVPFATEICTEVDLTKKRILVVLPEGLDEI